MSCLKKIKSKARFDLKTGGVNEYRSIRYLLAQQKPCPAKAGPTIGWYHHVKTTQTHGSPIYSYLVIFEDYFFEN